jgi:hypothetical protein
VSDIVTQVIQSWDTTRISTHYDDCWRSHPSCAIAILADEIERLRADDLHEQHQVGTDPARPRTEVGAADALANTLRALVAEQHDEIERLAPNRSLEQRRHGHLAGERLAPVDVDDHVAGHESGCRCRAFREHDADRRIVLPKEAAWSKMQSVGSLEPGVGIALALGSRRRRRQRDQ